MEIATKILKIKGFAILPVCDSSFDIHCLLDHLQSPLHQEAPLPCEHSVHEFAL